MGRKRKADPPSSPLKSLEDFPRAQCLAGVLCIGQCRYQWGARHRTGTRSQQLQPMKALIQPSSGPSALVHTA